jgi:hypothetical protein
MIYTPEQLTPIYLELSDQVSSALPADISERLVWSRNAFRHGSKTDVVLFNAWDSSQIGVERNQFNYCLNYKPLRPEENRGWLLQVRCNLKRIAKVYPGVRDVLRLKLRSLKKVCPEPFCYREDDQTVELRCTFNLSQPLAALPKFLAPRFIKLINTSHPVLVSAIDLFHRDAPQNPAHLDIGTVPRRKKAIRKDLSLYSPTLPAKLKLRVLDLYGNRCALCNKPVRGGN